RSFSLELFDPSAGIDLGYLHRATVSVADAEESSTVDYAFQPQLPPGDSLIKAAPLPDDRILMAYSTNYINGDSATFCTLVRINSDGTPDPTFTATLASDNGDPVDLHDLLPQPDGRVVVAGTFDRVNGTPAHTVARLQPDGSLDPTLVCPFNGAALAT